MVTEHGTTEGEEGLCSEVWNNGGRRKGEEGSGYE